jgi:DNA-binding transcriptional LysR family regulator
MLTYWDVHKHIARGELQRIALTDVKSLEVGIWAVFTTRPHMPARVRAFIDALRDRYSSGSTTAQSEPAGSL